MTVLSNTEKSSIQFHFTQTAKATVDYGNSLTKDYTTPELTRIQTAIALCNTAFNSTPLNAGSLVQESQEILEQNITVTTVRPGSTTTTTYGDRTKTTSTRPSHQKRLGAYYDEVEKLSRILGVELW